MCVCLSSQGLEFYDALKRQGVKTEMVIYPRQGHGPNEPRLIADIMQRNLDWFRSLGVGQVVRGMARERR